MPTWSASINESRGGRDPQTKSEFQILIFLVPVHVLVMTYVLREYDQRTCFQMAMKQLKY